MDPFVASRIINVEIQLNFNNVGRLYECFSNHSLTEEKDRCLAFLEKNAQSLICSDEFCDLPYKLLCDLFSRDTFCVGEVAIFKLILKWKAKHVTIDIGDLLRTIRWCHVSHIDYANVVRPQKIITDDQYFEWYFKDKDKRKSERKCSNYLHIATSSLQNNQGPLSDAEATFISSMDTDTLFPNNVEQHNGKDWNTENLTEPHKSNNEQGDDEQMSIDSRTKSKNQTMCRFELNESLPSTSTAPLPSTSVNLVINATETIATPAPQNKKQSRYSSNTSFWSTDETIGKFSYVVYDGMKLCICKVCEKPFSSRVNVLKHIATVHNGEKRFSCQYCNKRFTQKNGLFGHIKAIHEKAKDYKCFACGKSFVTKSNLTSHRKQHIKKQLQKAQ